MRLRASVQKTAAPELSGSGTLIDAFLSQLPFALTSAQQRVLREN